MMRRTLSRLAAPLALVLLIGALAACAPTTVQPAATQPAATQPAATQPAATTAPESSGSETITLYVGPELVDCTGVAPQKCMQVKDSPDGEWQNFYDPIAGFDYEPGYIYELKVEKTVVENPPADASKFTYTLVEIVSKTPVEASAAATPAPGEVATAPDVEGVVWQLQSLVDASGKTVDAMADIPVTAAFNNGQLSGNGGCNNYFGSYKVDGSSLTITPAGTTMMACPEAVMAQEQALMAALSSSASYQVANDQLQIMNADGTVVLTFTAQVQPSLTQPVWSATFYNNGKGAVVNVLIGTTITAVFGADSTLSGTAGCNQYSTTYTIDGSNMIISGAIATTMMACEQAVMDQEMAYLAALPTTASYSIVNGALDLRTTGGAQVASYAEAVMSSEATPETAEVAPAAGLEGSTWQLQSYLNDQGETVAALPKAPATALFAEGLVSGTTGCNRYGGAYTTDGDALTIKLGPVTMMACPDAQMVQEQGYLAALGSAATYKVADGQLTIMNADGATVVTFVPQVQPSLTGTPWQVTAYNNGRQAVVSVLADTQLTALFGDDGSLTGSGGCNQFNTTYKIDGSNITVDPAIAMTRKACAPEVMDQEQEYLAALVSAATFKTGGKELELRTASDALAASFVVAEPLPEAPATEATPVAVEPTPAVESTPEMTATLPDLTGIVWQWQGTAMSDDSQVKIKFPDRYTVEFLANGKVQMRADCNKGGGTYVIDGASLTMEVAAKTKIKCRADSKSNLFIKQLNHAVTYVMDGDQLVINLFADAGNMKFANGGPGSH